MNHGKNHGKTLADFNRKSHWNNAVKMIYSMLWRDASIFDPLYYVLYISEYTTWTTKSLLL